MAGYGDNTAFTAFLDAEGYFIAGDLSADVLRQRGSNYVDGLYGARFPGKPTGGLGQERAWPRTGATAFCEDIADDVIPSAIERASYFAALHEDGNPGSLSVAVSTAGQIKRKREKVDVIEEETEYFGSGDALKDQTVTLSAVEGLVAPFLVQEGLPGFGIFVV